MFTALIPNRQEWRRRKTNLAASITRSGSKQTYVTFRCLADRDRVDDGYRAYAYFRWLDDLLDCASGTRQEKTSLLDRQRALLEACYRRETPIDVCTEEQILVDLVKSDQEEQSGLQVYLRNMMQVMAFDVERCGRLISQAELNEYSRLLSTAVTELMFYLFGHSDPPLDPQGRYHAVHAAHIVHMLRDVAEDASVGYFNIPAELIEAGKIRIDQLDSLPYRKWVFNRVRLARKYFQSGRKYISNARSFRCRLAGFAYIARFEWMLRAIEKDHYTLRPAYPERKSFKALLWMVWRVITSSLNLPSLGLAERSGVIGLGEN